jgi:hypothetical protein
LLQLQEEHAAKGRDHDKVVADSAVMLGDLQGWQERAEALLGELERERQAHAATQAEHAAAVAGQTSLQESQAAVQAALAADRAAAAAREEALLAEKAQVGGGGSVLVAAAVAFLLLPPCCCFGFNGVLPGVLHQSNCCPAAYCNCSCLCTHN